MKFTPEAQAKVLAALNQRGAPHNCPLCHQSNRWAFADAFYFMVAQDGLPNVSLGGRGMPCAALVCSNCGNTQFINLLVLGLADLVGMTPILQQPE
jgi:hypothetical protein